MPIKPNSTTCLRKGGSKALLLIAIAGVGARRDEHKERTLTGRTCGGCELTRDIKKDGISNNVDIVKGLQPRGQVKRVDERLDCAYSLSRR